MTLAILVAFWVSIALIVYAYLAYPLLVDWVARIRPRTVKRQLSNQAAELPVVTVIIPAHNEERWIERKIENTLALDYPHERMQVLVASDGSTDRTVEIAKQFASRGVEVVHYPERAGKVATLNRTVPCAAGDIVFFTDANALLDADALRLLIPHFNDPQVGCAGGNRICLATNNSSTEGESLYWRYEAWIRYSESRLHSGLGAYGQIFAVRRYLFPYVPAISDDFPIPMKILVSTGARTVFEPRAKASIPAALTLRQEWERKVRSHVAFLYDLSHLKKGLNPLTSRIWWEFWSHHMFRMFVPSAMLVALAVSPWLWRAGMVYQLALCGQLLFYVSALAGYLLIRRGIRWRPLYLCLYFMFANLAVAQAWIRWFRGGNFHTWQRTERVVPHAAAAGRATENPEDPRLASSNNT